MGKYYITISIFLLSITNAFAQEMTKKELALEAFKKEHYDEAIGLMNNPAAEQRGIFAL